MVFSELVSKILETRNISARDLGDAIGITGQTISNLKSGRVLKPDAKTCEALLSYCKTYGIDTSELNWNDVIRGYFLNSKYATDYEWVSDVDENANIRLRHKKCRRITTVPIMSLSGISTPCIFCWVEAYMAQDSYSINLDSLKTEFPIKHYRCGHSYNVSYEQIKQKKYFCPICYRNKSGENEEVSYGARQDYRFITEPDRIALFESPPQPCEEFVDESEDDTPLSELTFDDFLSAFDEKPRKKAEKNQQQQKAQRQAEEEQRSLEQAQQQKLDQRAAEREARKLAATKRRVDRVRRREEINTISRERNFSVEYESSPYGDFSLDLGEIALLCNQCGKEVIFDFDDPNLLHKIEGLTCGCKTSDLQDDLLVLTMQGNLAWCADLLRVISLVDLTTFNGFSFDGINHFNFPEGGDKEVYFAADPSNPDYAYAFVIYSDETDAWLSKYLLFKFEITTWGTPQVEVEIFGRWPYYYEKLYESICQDINKGAKRNNITTEKSFGRYVSAYNSLRNSHSSVWDAGRILSAMEGLTNTLNKISGNECISKDPHLQQYMDHHMCPVCKKLYTNTDRVCSECGHDGRDQQEIDELAPAKGIVVDTKIDESRGPCATLTVQSGTLNRGDIIVIGTVVGRIRLIIDDQGEPVKTAGPTSNVSVTGLSDIPKLGEVFEVVDNIQTARNLTEERKAERQAEEALCKVEESARWRAEKECRLTERVQRGKEDRHHAEIVHLICVLQSFYKIKQQEECQRSEQVQQLIGICNRIAKIKRQDEALRKAEEDRRLNEERKKSEKARLQEESRRKAEEERRKAEETMRLKEAQRKAEEEARSKAEEERRLTEERRKAEETMRLKEAQRKVEEEKRIQEEKRALYRKHNCCQHCGGEFKAFLGIFGKKCRACNRPKDY